MTKLYGAIEAGGTKFVCAVGTGPQALEEIRFATTTPTETLQRAIEFFMPYRAELKSLGIASFGPIDLNTQSRSWGYITSTPKPGWGNINVAGAFSALAVPIAFDTDVNAAALGEGCWGAAQGLSDYIYITIGTGIGGGAVVGGRLLHGLIHPEMGHSFLPKLEHDGYKGRCPYHADRCFEGLASGPAIEERWQVSGVELPTDHPAWEMEAEYIAMALSGVTCTLSPQRIIVGGGVMEQPALINRVRDKLQGYLNGYIQHPAIIENMENYVVLPGLGNRAGILGALVLAKQAET